MKIAIVGSEGYLGSELVRTLGGHDLLRIDAGVWRDPPEGVIRERTATKIVNRIDRFGADHVVVLAALAHDPAGLCSEPAMHENTGAMPAAVAILCERPATVVSSLSVFSEAGRYPQAKRFLERELVRTPAWRNRINVFRFGTLYGPSDPAAFRQHLLLNSMVMSAVKDNRIRVSNPALRRPVLHISNAVHTIHMDITGSGPRGEVKNVLDHCDTIGGYAHIVGRVLGCGAIEAGPEDLDERDYGWEVRSPLEVERHVADLAVWVRQYADKFNYNAMDALRAWHDRYYA